MVNSDWFKDGKKFPPGFRFHPTDEELVVYYLKKKICCKRHRFDAIGVTDVYKWDPEDLPEMSKLKTGDRQWFFFTPRERKHPNATRSNRATSNGYWKVTGKDRVISCGSRDVGIKKTLVFYRGRAPSKGRTDWVMHEYTMDEEELKRCPNAKDYFALYKVFKKSGLGPKNGEQYGALFREEDWADDETEVQCLIEKENSIEQGKEISTIDDAKTVDHQHLSTVNDHKEHANPIADGLIPVQHLVAVSDNDVDQFVANAEAQGTSVENLYRDVPLPVFSSYSQQSNPQASFDDLTQSCTIESQVNVAAPDVSSGANIDVLDCLFLDDLDDFLEMADLTGQDPTLQKHSELGNHLEKLPFDNLVDLDTSKFFDYIMPGEIGFDCGVADPTSSSYSRHCEATTINHQMQQQFSNASGMNSQLRTEEQNCSSATATEVNQGCNPSLSSGNVHETQNHDFVNHNAGATSQQDDVESWFSSSLWSFLDSIPSPPASACESALVNKALRQPSSFSRGSTNAVKKNIAVGNDNATSRSRTPPQSGAGLIFLSFLGILCALLCVLVGTSSRAMGLYL